MSQSRSAPMSAAFTPPTPMIEVFDSGMPVRQSPETAVAKGVLLRQNGATRFNAGVGNLDALITATALAPVLFWFRASAGKRVYVEEFILTLVATGMTMDKFASGAALTNGILLGKTRLIGNVHTTIYDITNGVPIRRNSSFNRFAVGAVVTDPAGAGPDVLVMKVRVRDSYGIPLVLDGSNPADLSQTWLEGVQMTIQDNMDAGMDNLTVWLSGNEVDL